MTLPESTGSAPQRGCSSDIMCYQCKGLTGSVTRLSSQWKALRTDGEAAVCMVELPAIL
jgi:hypothetical protein